VSRVADPFPLAAVSPLLSSIDFAIDKVTSDLARLYIESEQKISLQKFASGHDLFVSLPTGFGKPRI